MNLLCRLLGHKPRPWYGYTCHPTIRSPYHDGILRAHRDLYVRCERCDTEYKLGKVIDPILSGRDGEATYRTLERKEMSAQDNQRAAFEAWSNDKKSRKEGYDAFDIWQAAIKHDRKRQGEVVVTKTPEGEIIAVTRQDDEGKILSVIAEAVPLSRGEAVAWPRNAKEIRCFIDTHFISMAGGDEASDDDKYLLTAHDLLSAFDWWTDFAPQPAEPVKSTRPDGGPDADGFFAQIAAEPVKDVSNEELMQLLHGSGAISNGVSQSPTIARWKDGINIDYPALWVERFAHALLSLYGQPGGNPS